MSDEQARRFFRFTKTEIHALVPHLHLDQIRFRNRYTAIPEEALCLVLYRLSWPHRYVNTIHLFGHWHPWISTVFNDTIKHLAERYRQLLYWDHDRLTLDKTEEYASAVEAVCGVPNIYGFIDGTIRPICRPSTVPQRPFYTGFKKVHGFKFQGISYPDGILTLAEPYEASAGD
jgi:hypothetical protein